MKTRPPMPSRDSGGKFTLNNPDDGTPITEMFKLGKGLLMITEKCTYRTQVADQIDQIARISLNHRIFSKNRSITAQNLICYVTLSFLPM
jgi:hypothetical protein